MKISKIKTHYSTSTAKRESLALFLFGKEMEDKQHITQMEVEKQHALLCLIFQSMPWNERCLQLFSQDYTRFLWKTVAGQSM